MKKYDITDNFRDRVHTVKVTFQYCEYKGYIAYEVGGNCRGLDVMNPGFDSMSVEDIENLKENTCSLSFNEEHEVWTLILKDENDNELEIDAIGEYEIEQYVVAIEIIDCKVSE